MTQWASQCPVVEVDTDSLDFSEFLARKICTSRLFAGGLTGLCRQALLQVSSRASLRQASI